MDERYFAVTRALPRPSIEQTVRFAWFVSDAHSWYKHLPADHKVPFNFYLDPDAGRNYVVTSTGEHLMVDVTDESVQFHYTWQTTATYRRRFGHWNYNAPYGNGFMFAADGGIVDTAGIGPSVLDQIGNLLSVPASALMVGTANVNAYVHPMHDWWLLRDPVALRESLLSFADATTTPAAPPDVLNVEWIAAVESRLARLRKNHPDVSVLIWGDDKLYDDEWESHLRSLGATSTEVWNALALLQWRLVAETTATPLPTPPKDLDVLPLYARERNRQLTDMWEAMRNVSELTYGALGN
jgi:hypothetical protein